MPHVKRIGIIVDMARSYSRKMFQGALTYAREAGDVRFATHPAYPDFDELEKCDGAIVQAFNQGQANVVSSYDMPLVWVLSCPEYTPNPVLKPNDREVGKLVANYLIERGYRNLAYVTSNPNAEFSRLRFEGFAQVVRQHGYSEKTYPDLESAREKGTVEADLSGLVEWLESQPRPLGIMASHDTAGREIMVRLARTDLHVPEHVAVVGVDNDEAYCETVSPPLSSVALPFQKIGYEAASLLDKLMKGRPPGTQNQLFSPLDVVTRGSSDSLAVDDPLLEQALKFIRQHATDKLDVSELADQIPVSRRSLERHFQDTFGHSPHQIITRVRVEIAKRHLADTNWLMREVAAKSGFSDAAKLSSWFKKITGMTPTEYRKKFRTP